MSWASLQERQQAAVYRALGFDAQWDGITDPVRVILRDDDALIGVAVDDRSFIRVRESEVATPADGQELELEDGRRFRIVGTPLRDRKRNWRCEARPL